jgi:UDP-N-acetylglucosamine 4,6-dehydratase
MPSDMKTHFRDRVILVTGGTGSFGRSIVRRLVEDRPREVRVFSRDEKTQDDMRREFDGKAPLRFVLGDVRDQRSVVAAMVGVDTVFHTAALKQVPSCERSPYEAVLTNVMGAQNVIDAAIQERVERMVAISTDKAVEPVNAMGMTKALQEKLVFAAHQRYRGLARTIFSCVRYGNVLGSRGSVVPLFKASIERKEPLRITDPEMTRFVLTLDDAVDLVLKAARDAEGGELFVRKSPAHTIGDLAHVMIQAAGGNPRDYPIQTVGTRPGEKVHETLVSPAEARRIREEVDHFVIMAPRAELGDGPGTTEGCSFRYTSDTATRLTHQELVEVLRRTGWLPGM